MAMREITDLADWIRKRDYFAVVPHVSPDGDTLGSALAVNRMLKLLGKHSCIASHDAPAKMYAFLPDIGAVTDPDSLPFEPEWLLFVDVGSIDRAGSAWRLMDGALGGALIDHHETNAGFCEMSIVDGSAAATAELVVELMDELGVAMDESLAIWIYTAISTDTGNFSYSNTTPTALTIAARCIEAGLRIDEINRLLFRSRTLARAMMLGSALEAMRFAADGCIAYTCLTDEMFLRCGATHADTEGIASYINEIEGVEVSITLEIRENSTKVSLRSNGMVHVGEVAKALGGGGHERAAGVTLICEAESAACRVIRAIQERLS